jgi:hypothetical protein
MKKLLQGMIILIMMLVTVVAAQASISIEGDSSRTITNDQQSELSVLFSTNATGNITWDINGNDFKLSNKNESETKLSINGTLEVGSYIIKIEVSNETYSNETTFTLTVNEEPRIDPLTIELGGPKESASNPEEDEIEVVPGEFTVYFDNDGDLSCEVTPVGNFKNDLTETDKFNINVTFDGNTTYESAYTKNEDHKVTFEAHIPAALSAMEDFVNKAFKVADIKCEINNEELPTTALEMQRKNMLEIYKIQATYNSGGSFREDNDIVRNIKPGEIVELEVELRNLFFSRDYIDIDVTGTLECESSDIFIDIDSDEIFLISGDKQSSLFFEIEFDEDYVDNKIYDCTLEIEGEDNYDAIHGEKWNLRFEVERENYKIEIDSLKVTPSILKDTNREITVNTQIRNVGRTRDFRIKLEVEIPELGISEIIEEDLDSKGWITRTINLRLDQNLDYGEYEVVVNVYSKGLLLTDTKTAIISYPDPTPPANDEDDEEEEEEPEEPPVVIIQPPVDNVTVDPIDTEPTEERSYVGIYIALLIVFIIVVIGGIVGMLIYLVKA